MPSIPPFRLVREPLSPEAEQLPGFEWAVAEVGRRHQLGGEPGWLQGGATPVCRECGESMTFYRPAGFDQRRHRAGRRRPGLRLRLFHRLPGAGDRPVGLTPALGRQAAQRLASCLSRRLR
jgi:hypothetical protein